MVGVLSGNEVSMNISAVLAKWIAIQGITVSHREDFLSMNRFLESERIGRSLTKSCRSVKRKRGTMSCHAGVILANLS